MYSNKLSFQHKCFVVLMGVLTRISPTFATKVVYRRYMHKKLDLKHPKDLNEKVLWLKLNTYRHNPLITQCVDKYAVRAYIKAHGSASWLTELCGVYDDLKEIDFMTLPKSYVVKNTNGSQMYHLVKDSSKEDIENIKKIARTWLRGKFYLKKAEMQYEHVKNRILIEHMIETEPGEDLKDYKVFCSYGKAICTLMCTERELGLKLLVFDNAFNFLPNYTVQGQELQKELEAKHQTIEDVHPKPEGFDRLLVAARRLSKDFPFVRVDFYIVKGQLIFGELTFVPAAGMYQSDQFTQEALDNMGAQIKLPYEVKS